MNLFHLSPNSAETSRLGNTKKMGYFDDPTRVFLLALMMVALIFGFFFKTYINDPVRIIGKSAEKAVSFPFMASLEGETSIKGYPVAWHRSRQSYYPSKGIETIGIPEKSEDDSCPCSLDAVSALKLVRSVQKAKEVGRQDMFGSPTRYFTGKYFGENGTITESFDFKYWVDLRSFLPVRLSIVYLTEGEPDLPGARQVTLDIRYYGWVLPEKNRDAH